jgi:hypothetical protein
MYNPEVKRHGQLLKYIKAESLFLRCDRLSLFENICAMNFP